MWAQKGQEMESFHWSSWRWGGSPCPSGISADLGSCTCSEGLGGSVEDTFISEVFSHMMLPPHTPPVLSWVMRSFHSPSGPLKSCYPSLVFQAEHASFIPKNIHPQTTPQQHQNKNTLLEKGLAEESAGIYSFCKTC